MSTASISDQIADRLRDLRKRSGLTRDQLAEAAREAGAAGTFTGSVVGFLETGRPGKDGRRTRLFALDEIFAVAAALEISPVELLGDTAQLFIGETQAVEIECPSCGATPGPLELITRKDLAQLGELSPLEETLTETAYRLAGAIDKATGDLAKMLPSLTKELRATVQEIGAGRRRVAEPEEDDDFGDLDEPV